MDEHIQFCSLTTASSDLPLLFTIGDIIEIDSKDNAYIIDISGDTYDLFLKWAILLVEVKRET